MRPTWCLMCRIWKCSRVNASWGKPFTDKTQKLRVVFSSLPQNKLSCNVGVHTPSGETALRDQAIKCTCSQVMASLEMPLCTDLTFSASLPFTSLLPGITLDEKLRTPKLLPWALGSGISRDRRQSRYSCQFSLSLYHHTVEINCVQALI